MDKFIISALFLDKLGNKALFTIARKKKNFRFIVLVNIKNILFKKKIENEQQGRVLFSSIPQFKS